MNVKKLFKALCTFEGFATVVCSTTSVLASIDTLTLWSQDDKAWYGAFMFSLLSFIFAHGAFLDFKETYKETK